MSGADTSVAEAELAFRCGLAGATAETKLMTERMVHAICDAFDDDTDEYPGEVITQGALRVAAIFVMLNSMPHQHARNIRIAASLLVRIAAEIDVAGGTFQGFPPAVSWTVQ